MGARHRGTTGGDEDLRGGRWSTRRQVVDDDRLRWAVGDVSGGVRHLGLQGVAAVRHACRIPLGVPAVIRPGSRSDHGVDERSSGKEVLHLAHRGGRVRRTGVENLRPGHFGAARGDEKRRYGFGMATLGVQLTATLSGTVLLHGEVQNVACLDVEPVEIASTPTPSPALMVCGPQIGVDEPFTVISALTPDPQVGRS